LKEKIGAEVIDLTIGKRYLLMLTSKGEVWAVGSNENNPFNQ
jgi:alpha-tubulin suppressor-like RCC1 family protein